MEELKERLNRAQRLALIVGVVAAAACGYGAMSHRHEFYQSYLLAFTYWMGITGGSLGLLCIHHLVSGKWGFVIQRPLEAAVRTLPLMALFFIPIVLGIHDLFHWSHAEAIAHDEILQKKVQYLNEPFFIGRAVFYFFIWSVLGYSLCSLSRRQEETGNPDLSRRMSMTAGPGMVIFVLTMSFASFDWGMSVEPHWFSTMYGPLFMAGQALTTLSFMAFLLHRLAQRKPLMGVATHPQFHDIGNLMFAFTILWTYMSISEYIIIWSGNIPEETSWYLHRMKGGWTWVALILAVCHFAIPFFLLLFKSNKRHSSILSKIALWILAIHIVDIYWRIIPAYRETVTPNWMDFAAPVAMGGIWIAAFLGILKKRTLLPVQDPRFKEMLETHVGGGHGY